MLIIVQHDATVYSLFISVNRSTYCGWYLHPSSGANVTVSTAPGTSKTVTAMNVGSRPVTFISVTALLTPDAVDTVTLVVEDGCGYHPQYVERFTDVNKLYIL